MTSDFDNEEIQDSAFPVDFNDDTNSLDMYGVWVKSGPRDAEIAEPTAYAVSSELDGLADMNTFDDISGLPDLPDFDESSAISESHAETSDDDTITEDTPMFEEDLTEKTRNLPVDDFELGAALTSEPRDEDLPDMDFLTEDSHNTLDSPETFNSIESFDDLPEYPVSRTEIDNVVEEELDIPVDMTWESTQDSFDNAGVSLSSSPVDGIEPYQEDSEIIFDDSAIELSSDMKKMPPETEKFPQKTSDGSVSVDDSEEISLDMFTGEDSVTEDSETILSHDEFTGDALKDIEFEDVNALSDWNDEPDNKYADSSAIDMEAAIEASMQNETVDNHVLEEEYPVDALSHDSFPPTGSPDTLPSDDEFSSFLDDLNASDPKNDGAHFAASSEVDLDSFIDQFNETGGRTEAETEKLFDDTAPVDLDLDFDEDFIADAQMIKETGSSVSESEFMTSEFGVEMIDETPAASQDDNFDELFAEAGLSDVVSTPIVSRDKSQSIQETNEFDDLLLTLDNAPTPAHNTIPAEKRSSAPKSFDLSVSDEDGSGTIAAPTTENSSDDFDIALFGSESSVPLDETTFNAPDEEENLVIDDIKDYNTTENIPDNVVNSAEPGEVTVSLDFDDISAVENDLSDLTPETGDIDLDRNDKSTELLMQIADELSSIKNELSVLKSELAGFRTAQASPIPAVASEIDEQKASGGFFNDDDPDEAIALTGDELNNILITADFTEEKNESPSETVSGTVDTSLSLPADTIPSSASDDEYEVPDTLPDSLFEMPKLEDTADIEVGHVNSIDEDMSYLEESDVLGSDMDNVAIEEPEMEIIDFNDENLEEPELEEFNINLDDLDSEFPPEQDISRDTVDYTEPETTNIADFADFGVVSDENSALEEDLSIPEDNLELDSFDTVETENYSVLDEPVISAEPQVQLPEIEPESDSIQETAENLPADEIEEQTSASAFETSEVATGVQSLPIELKDEIKSVLSYMDQLLESLPEDKIEEFARSEHFSVYRKLFEELGIS